MTDWKSLAAQAQPTTRVARLCLRGDLAAAAADAPDDQALADEVEQATVPFKFCGLTRQKYRALEAAHPDPDGGAGWNIDTFPEALVRSCLVSPIVEADDPLFDVLTAGQVEVLFEAAFGVCTEVTEVPLRRRG